MEIAELEIPPLDVHIISASTFLKSMGNISAVYYFYYKNVPCIGRIEREADLEKVIIRPIYTSHDIGGGVGESVILKFRK